MQISTLPVFSQLAEETPLEIERRLPTGWRLSQHQVETYLALTRGEYDVVFNTAMTGDGKSLAGQLPTLLDPAYEQLFAMFPTNELVRDQERQLNLTRRQWSEDFGVGLLNGPYLDELMVEDDFSQRGDAVLSQLFNYEILLTNPDIFHYIMSHFYRRPGDAPDTIIGRMVNKFRQFTFDEFHIFETPQVISVVNAMLFIRQMAGPIACRFLFLSATPDEQMIKFLERSGLRYLEINPTIQGWYYHGIPESDPTRWRRILHRTDINFAAGQVEKWLDDHLEDTLLPFFENNRPKAKGAIIVNSIAAAKRIMKRLKPIFAERGLSVAENTGLTSKSGRAASYVSDLLVGTSTVDVGVDFNINFLLFESRDGGTFLQRLGRLGRHDGYERDGQTYNFETFVAYALVAPWVLERLFVGNKTETPLLQDGLEISRQQLNEAIQAAYPAPARFDNYIYDWGKFQSLNVMTKLSDKTIKTQYNVVREKLGEQYETTFNIGLRQAYAQKKELAGELINEAMSFRGGSHFQCAILDDTEEGYLGQPKLADLFLLVANGELGALDEAEFFNEVERQGLSKRPFEQANGSKRGPLAYFRLHGWRQERNDYELRLNQEIGDWDSRRFGQATVLKGFRLNAFVPGKTALNNRLQQRRLPVTLCLAYTHPLELKRRLYLPMLFPLYQFTSLDKINGCIAFGREALLLHTILQRRPQVDCGGNAYIF